MGPKRQRERDIAVRRKRSGPVRCLFRRFSSTRENAMQAVATEDAPPSRHSLGPSGFAGSGLPERAKTLSRTQQIKDRRCHSQKCIAIAHLWLAPATEVTPPASRPPMEQCYNEKRLPLQMAGSSSAFFLLATQVRHVGEWLSLVEHLVRDQGVGGSNPLSPTNLVNHINAISTVPSTALAIARK